MYFSLCRIRLPDMYRTSQSKYDPHNNLWDPVYLVWLYAWMCETSLPVPLLWQIFHFAANRWWAKSAYTYLPAFCKHLFCQTENCPWNFPLTITTQTHWFYAISNTHRYSYWPTTAPAITSPIQPRRHCFYFYHTTTSMNLVLISDSILTKKIVEMVALETTISVVALFF